MRKLRIEESDRGNIEVTEVREDQKGGLIITTFTEANGRGITSCAPVVHLSAEAARNLAAFLSIRKGEL